jgi:hypothetical protein
MTGKPSTVRSPNRIDAPVTLGMSVGVSAGHPCGTRNLPVVGVCWAPIVVAQRGVGSSPERAKFFCAKRHNHATREA